MSRPVAPGAAAGGDGPGGRSEAERPRGPGGGARRIVDLLRLSAGYLAEKGVDAPRLTAERLLAGLLEVGRVDLYLQYDRLLTEEELSRFRALLRRRAGGEPLQYILGGCEFYGLRLAVRPGVLIPRPESELIVDLAKRFAPEGGFPRALDAGCGVGALALALLAEGAAREVVAVDVSPQAVELTRENAEALGLAGDRLRILEGDAFASGRRLPGEPFDLIVSNPPYVREDEWAGLEREVRDHEPREALVSGADGLEAHRALAASLPGRLAPGGLFLGEIGAGQGEEAARVHAAWAARVAVHPDLEGRSRVVEAWAAK